MKFFSKQVIIILSIIATGFLLPSCKTSKATTTSEKQLEKSLLWEISGPGVKSPSYLFGTIHIIPSKDYFLPNGAMSALDASKKVVFEIDLKEMTDMSAMMGMMNKIMMKDNKSLKDLMSAADYKLVGDHFQKMGLPIFMLERLKPMFLTVFASGDMDPSGMQNGSMKSYEMELMELAKNAGKETGGLETIDFQLSLFDAIPYEAQAKMLVDAIKGLTDTEGEGEFAKMTKMYISQDINAMIETISEEGSDVSGFEDKLLTERNKNWIPQIIEGAKTQSTFYAVGAGHLAGPNGVIQLLRKAGMKVTPVKK